MKNKGLFVVALLGIAIVVIIMLVLNGKPFTDIDLSSRYTKIEVPAVGLEVINEVNVRSEPSVIESKADGDTNSFGTAKPSTVTISKVYRSSEELDANGAFYGFSVEELLKTEEGKSLFPKGIKNDPDGIVWISAKYIKVSYEEAPQN